MANPFLPLNTYIADGEPHVFGNRVYLFGSHDKAGGDTYCMHNYEFWSAPVENLETWSCKGVSYRADQDSAWTLPECGLILVAHRQPFRRAFQYDFFSCFIDSINVCSIDQNTFMTLHNFRIIDQL